MTENSEGTDLFGEPLRPVPDKRGRRKLRFPPEVYENVEVLAASEMSQDDIADAIGISAPTLRKYFRPELGKGLARQKAEARLLLAKAARGGNVSAIKAWLADLERHGASAAIKERERPTRPAAAERKGKKEERQDAAAGVAAAGGKYAPPPPPQPRLVIDNR